MLFTYMFIYNTTLVVLFWSIMSSLVNNSKSLYSFSSLSFDPYLLFFVSIALFSMAGVPPFIGFFSKVFILNLLINSNFFLLYFLLFVLLLVGLYFYMQNMRFLHSTNYSNTNKPTIFMVERLSLSMLYFSISTLIVVVSGISYMDDLLLFFHEYYCNIISVI